MAALYHRVPTEAELDGTGFTAADYEIDPVEQWPENAAAISLFASISTQWRMGMNGRSGLDYNVLFARMDRLKLADQEYEWLFEDVRVIEAEALSILNNRD